MQQHMENVNLFTGDSQMSGLMRAHDWSATPLGPVSGWSQSLKTAVRIILGSRYPMFIWWGRELVNLYNDGYLPMLGRRHPTALGKPAAVIWSEIWDTIGPQTDSVLYEGRATWNEERLLVMERNGYPEEAYFTFSYSPVPTDDGGVGGIFCALTEDTERVLGQRRLRTLRELAARTTGARTVEQACQAAIELVAQNPHDLPFTLIYLLDSEGQVAQLAGTTGLAEDSPACPPVIDLKSSNGQPACWPLDQVAVTGRAELVERLEARCGRLRCGVWPDPPQSAIVQPIMQSGQDRIAGFLVAGISPRRVFDDDYRGFTDLLAGHIATAIANARAYEEERRRAEALAELDRAKTTFFSNVSHEFRTPLTLILGPLDDAISEAKERWQRDRLLTLQRNALRLQKLVNTLLDFSRIEARRVQVSFQPVDLSALTRELSSNFQSACEKAGLELVVDCAPLPEPVYVDAEMWEKIVLNLVSNAFKFTFQGRIEVKLRRSGPHAELVVRDTGVGIPADQMPRLFERFHRVEGVTGRTQEGSGIGLALVRELVRLHGGEMSAESVVRKGTSFVVRVPFGTAHLQGQRIIPATALNSPVLRAGHYVEEALRWLPDAEATEGEEPTSVGTHEPEPDARQPVSGERPRILLADDNADMRQYLRRLLCEHYHVEAVSDGQAALDAVRRSRPDLILSDVMMPRLDGFGLLREIRADQALCALPVILLSARAGEESRAEGMQAVADDYLVKPFGARELLARVSAHLQMARLRRRGEDEARRNNELFRLVHQIGKIGHWEWNSLTDENKWSPEIQALYGLEPGTFEGTYEAWARLVHPDDLPRAEEDVRRALETGKYFTEFRVVWPDGSVHWLEARANVFKDGHDKAVRIIGVNMDITERKRFEEALREADRRKDEFLAMLAHELRNPLAPIRNALHVIQMRGQERRQAVRQAWEMIERQVENLVRLVDDLLDVSRISRGKINLQKEPVDVATLVARAVEGSRPLIEARRHDLKVALSDEPMRVEADPTRMAQVLWNLLNNAAKYTPEDGRIWLTASKEGGEAVIRVRDTGMGIPPELLPKMFDLFVQAERTLDRAEGGLGIGLTLVRRLTELHDGVVEAFSAGPGEGSEFVVRLPLLPDVSPAAAAHEPDGDKRVKAAVTHRILVVDDNRDSADSLAILLRLVGHDVCTAHDGRQALVVAATYRPDLVLLDIGLPGMDGLTVARHLRSQQELAGVVLVALTGYGSDEDRRQAQAVGFNHHMVKPLDLDALNELLSALEPHDAGRV
jgi:PAS domain S-box-containing protein